MARQLPIAFIATLAAVVFVSACSKRNSEEVKAALDSTRAAEVSGDRAAMARGLLIVQRAGVLLPEERTKLEKLQSVLNAPDSAAAAVTAGNRKAVIEIFERVQNLGLSLGPGERILVSQASAGLAIEPDLDLAREKSDIDQTYLGLKRMENVSFLSPVEKSELAKSSQALQDLQALRNDQANHDHEAVVLDADRILSTFPKNVEARRAFRESGLIFSYLEQAVQELKAISLSTKKVTALTSSLSDQLGSMNGNPSQTEAIIKLVDGLIGFSAEEMEPIRAGLLTLTKTRAVVANFDHQVAMLADADKFLASALQLDPQYSESLAMKNMVTSLQNFMLGVLAEKLTAADATACSAAESEAVDMFNSVNWRLKLDSNTLSPWDLYVEHSGGIKFPQLERAFDNALSDNDQWVATLRRLRNSGNGEYVDAAGQFIQQTPAIIRGLISPSGTWANYSAAIRTAQSQELDLTSKITAAKSEFSTEFERASINTAALEQFDYLKRPERTKPILQKRKELLTAI
jgi:hypothetical protein